MYTTRVVSKPSTSDIKAPPKSDTSQGKTGAADSSRNLRGGPIWIKPSSSDRERIHNVVRRVEEDARKAVESKVKKFSDVGLLCVHSALESGEVFDKFRAAVDRGSYRKAEKVVRNSPRKLLAATSVADGQTMLSTVTSSDSLSPHKQVRLVRFINGLLHPAVTGASNVILPTQVPDRRIYKAATSDVKHAFPSAAVVVTPDGSRLHYDPAQREFPRPPTRLPSSGTLHSIQQSDSKQVRSLGHTVGRLPARPATDTTRRLMAPSRLATLVERDESLVE